VARRAMAVGLVAVLALGACSSAKTESGNQGTYRIVSILGLSGALAATSQVQKQATQAAVDYLNTQGGILGRTVEVAFKDDQSDATKAVSLLQGELTSGRKPDLVLPGSSSNETLALLPVLNQNKILSIAPTGAPKISDTAAYPFSFGSSFRPTDSAQATKNHVVSLGVKKVAMLGAADAFGESWAANLTKAFQGTGITVTAEKYDPTSLDMTAQLQRLRSGKPDVLLLEAYGAPTPRLLQSRAKINWFDTPAIGDLTITATDPWKAVNDPNAFNGLTLEAYAVMQYKPIDQQSPAIATMITEMKKLGTISAALSTAAGNWDMLQTIKAATTQANSIDAAAVAKALENLTTTAAWTQNGGAAPGYTKDNHFAAASPDNYVWIKAGPLTDGMINSSSS
jgi:branched-chain amino acid transport system substrate-binding protein